MSLIACTSHCIYQEDGYCALDRAACVGQPSTDEDCVNFIPRPGTAVLNRQANTDGTMPSAL
jgi:hypothetical protein